MDNESVYKCRICNTPLVDIIKERNIPEAVTPDSFKITDSMYGITGTLYKCSNCAFVQCHDFNDIIGFYENVTDSEYDHGREERSLQFNKMLKKVSKYKSGTLLDVGAGTGMLVEQALKMGFTAEGIEPSKWLQNKATQYGLPVLLGTVADISPAKKYDIITLIDIIEHTDDPAGLLKECHGRLNDEGLLVVVTPNVNSFCAKILGKKWWHYRIAHIGYFSKHTLRRVLKNTGFKPIKWHTPGWHFTLSYITERFYNYTPKWLRIPRNRLFDKIVIPLNLGDSMLALCQKEPV